jgi:hypothetical protein
MGGLQLVHLKQADGFKFFITAVICAKRVAIIIVQYLGFGTAFINS